MAHLAGAAAEASVAADYARRGFPIARRRFRGRSGEIDLIARDGAGFILVEVKKAATFARAAERVTRRKIERIFAAAGEFLAAEFLGMNTELRLDLAFVDAHGAISIVENVMAD
jgi:putative endonuclease